MNAGTIPAPCAYFDFPNTPYVTEQMRARNDPDWAALWFVQRYLLGARRFGIRTVFLREWGRWSSSEPQVWPRPNSGPEAAMLYHLAMRYRPDSPFLIDYQPLPAGGVDQKELLAAIATKRDLFDADAWDQAVGCSTWHKALIEFLAGPPEAPRPQLLEPEDDDAHPDQWKYPKVLASSIFDTPMEGWQRPQGPADYCWFQTPPVPAGEDARTFVIREYTRFVETVCRPNKLMPCMHLGNVVDLAIEIDPDGNARA